MGSVFFPENDVEQIRNGRTSFTGGLLLADISGFTEITENLSKGGRTGVEELTSLLNRCFDTILKTVEAYGGSTLTFSGDSILVRFSDPASAEAAAIELLKRTESFRRVIVLGRRFSISLKVVVGKGCWNQFIAGGRQRAHIILSGGLVDELARREETASPGDLVVFTGDPDSREVSFPPPETLPESFISPGSKRMFGEHRPVTPVFMKVGWKTGGAPDPESFQRLYLSILRTVKKHGGYLHHIDCMFPSGTGILALFGAPVSMGPDPLNAVSAALELFRQPDLPGSLNIACGIDTGYVFAGMTGNDDRKEYTVIGDPVNTAARLAGHSAPGQITVSSRTAAGTAGAIAFGKPLEVILRGKSGKLTVFHAKGILRSASSSPFVGRKSELGLLLRTIRQGKGPVVVSGNAGVGKTTLLKELRRELEGSDHTVFRCSGSGREYPAGILSSLLRTICSIGEGDSPGEAEERLFRLVQSTSDPGLMRRKVFLGNMLLGLSIEDENFRRLPPELKSENLMDGLILLLRSLGDGTCVFIEDLHCAHQEEIALLMKLIRGVRKASGLTFILSTRPEGLKNIPDGTDHISMPLDGLSPEESSRLLLEYSDGQLIDWEVSEVIMEKAEGNPFFLVQFLMYLKENGLISLQNGVWKKTEEESLTGLPESIFSMIMARIDTLSETTRESLKVASVVGMRFTEPVLEKLEHREVHSDLDESGGAGLTRLHSFEELEHIFSHMLIRDVAYDSILTERRRQLHREIGLILEKANGASSGFLARHFLEGQVWEKALEHSMKAGRASGEQFRNLEALEHFNRGACVIREHLPEMGNSLAECLHESGHIHDRLGNYDESARCYREAVGRSRDTSLILKSLMAIANILFNQGETGEGLELVSEVERVVQQSGGNHFDVKLQVAAYRAWVHCIDGKMEEAEKEALRAVELGELITGTSPVEKAGRMGHALNTLATVHWARSELSRARELYQRAIEIALANGMKREAAVTWGNIALTLEKQGKFLESQEATGRKLSIAEEIGEKFLIMSAHGELGLVYGTLGRFKEAVHHMEMHRDLAERIGVPHDHLLALNHLAMVLLTQGDLDGAEALTSESFSILNSFNIERERAHTLFIAGKTAFEKGALPEALALFEEAHELAVKIHSATLAHHILLEKGELHLEWGNLELARKAMEEAHTISKNTGEPLGEASSRLLRAKVLHGEGELTRAIQEADSAIGSLEVLGTRYCLAEALRWKAEKFRDTNEMDRARGLFMDMDLPRKAEECRL